MNDPEMNAINAEEMDSATSDAEALKKIPPEVLINEGLFVFQNKFVKVQGYRILFDADRRLCGRTLASLMKKHEA